MYEDQRKRAQRAWSPDPATNACEHHRRGLCHSDQCTSFAAGHGGQDLLVPVPDQARLVGHHHELHTIPSIELGEQSADMRLGGGRTHE